MSSKKSIVYFLSCETSGETLGANIPKSEDDDTGASISYDMDHLDAAVSTHYVPSIIYLPRQAPPPLSRWKMLSTLLLRCTSFAEQRRRIEENNRAMYVPPHAVGILMLPFISRGFVPEMRFLLDTFVAQCVDMSKRYLLILTTCRDTIDDGERCIARVDVLRIILKPWFDVLTRVPVVVMTKFGVKPFNNAQRRLLREISDPNSSLFDDWRQSQNEFLIH